MPTYKVTDPQTGSTIKLTGDAPPTETELNDIFSKIRPTQAAPKQSLGDTFTNVVKTFAPAATNIASDVGKVAGSRIQLATNAKLSQEEDAFAQRLLQRAKAEKDVFKREKLLKNYRSYINEIGKNQQERIAPPEFSEDVNRSIPERAIAASGEVGALLMPQMGATSRVGRIGAAALQSGASSALRSATAIADTPEDRIVNTLMDTMVGTVTGGVFQSALEGVGVAKNFYSNKFDPKVREKGYDLLASTFKENQQAVKAMSKQGGEKEVAKKIITYNLPKTAKGAVKELEEYRPQFNDLVEKELTSPKYKSKMVNYGDILDQVEDDIVKSLDTLETQAEFKQAMNYIKSAKKEYKTANLLDANKLRQRLDKITGEQLFTDVKGKEKAIKIFAGYLRNTVKTEAKETVPLFDRYALLTILPKIYQKDPRLGLVEATGALAGGSVLGGGVGGAVGLMASLGLRSPSLKRRLGRIVTQMPKTPKVPSVSSEKVIPFLSAFVNRK